MKASVVVRTYNESRHLGDVLERVRAQRAAGQLAEVIVVDSGSTDETLKIAADHGCRIEHIKKEDFSFGRSLNIGCQAATGEILVFISGHCIPVDESWLERLVEPLADGRVVWTYGRQIGNGTSHFSEQQIFRKYFPPVSQVPQDGFFCNNANSALLRAVWERHPFDEELTGLEDMHLAQRLVTGGMRLGYVAEAPVFHLHHETWGKVRNRFEREAIALQRIMPGVHVTFGDFLRYVTSSIMLDFGEALQQGALLKNAGPIVMYRLAQYWGSYQGNHLHRKLSRELKEQYFYPR